MVGTIVDDDTVVLITSDVVEIGEEVGVEFKIDVVVVVVVIV